MPNLTGGQIVARALKEYGVEYVSGIPGHGIWSLTDAFLDEESKIPFLHVFHEQSAVHIADGYYRVTGRPMAAVTSIGAGASNTVIGLATAYTDSTSVLVITGGPPTHLRGTRFGSRAGCTQTGGAQCPVCRHDSRPPHAGHLVD